MADPILMAKIKKLAQVSERNKLLDFELSGYMKDETRAEIFKKDAIHTIKKKKKYTYVDYGNPNYQSGWAMVENEGANKGVVWGIKAYGQKGRYMGDIDQVISQIEKNNQSLINGILEKTKGKSFVAKTSDKIIIHDKNWGY